MKKYLSMTLLAMALAVASYGLTPITGPTSGCAGLVTWVSDTTSGGTWSSSNTAVATIGTSSGMVTCISAGVTTLTYTLGTSYVTSTFTVSGSMPAPITGTTTFCMGTTSTLTDATPGGTWSSGSWIATVGSATGVVTGVSAGTVPIYYTVITGCSQTINVTITSTAPTLDSILGPTTVCTGSTVTLTNSVSGGVWTSSAPARATVGSATGVVTGVSVGSADISYTVSLGCGSSTTDFWIGVSSTTSAGTILGTASLNAGDTYSYVETVGGGTWTSSNPAVATIDPATGIATGVSAGTATITYTVSGCSGTAYTTSALTVSVVNRISGTVHFTGMGTIPPGTYDTMKVWLITYDPATLLLQAADSLTALVDSDSSYDFYYQFLGEPTDSYRVKAALYPAVFTGTGYIPTYHTSSYFWHDASAFYHTSGADDGEDINMMYGSTATGPGFVSGNVTMGANKGTSGTVPAVGVLVYAINSSGTLIQQSYTDASGAYSFSNLPLGTYTIYPEAINYHTVAYTGVTLTAGSHNITTANFGQHTVSRTILPIVTGIKNTASSVSSVIAFPSPTSGRLNIQWNENATEKGTLTVSDITGRELYRSELDMNQGSGGSQADLSGLAGGTYLISVKTATINYTSKIELMH